MSRLSWPETQCPSCGGYATVERDWRGDEVVRCDAYRPCDARMQQRTEPAWFGAETEGE